MNTCSICSKETINSNYCIETCIDDYCYKYNDNYLTKKYNQFPLVFELLFNTAFSCLSSKIERCQEIYKPRPKKLSIENLKNIIPKEITNDNFHNIFSSFKKDKDIVDKYGLNFYYFLKYTILSNNINLIPSKLINAKNTFLEKDPTNIYEENIQFDITYSPDIENKFKTSQIHYLFHGSGSSNWYGMLRNGIKNFSNTKLMSNGAAHGHGIYLSDSLTFAKGYSSKYYSNNTDELLIVGVCQVKQEISAYKKVPNIYVVADDSELLLRHIIIIRIKLIKYKK